jgi:hypothetical protein
MSVNFSFISRLTAERYCGPVPQIDNGFAIGSTNVTYRGQATYQCYAGFGFPSGLPVESITCTAEGLWEKLPTCLGALNSSITVPSTRPCVVPLASHVTLTCIVTPEFVYKSGLLAGLFDGLVYFFNSRAFFSYFVNSFPVSVPS